MRTSITSSLEMHGIRHPAASRWKNGVAGLVGSLEYAKTLAAIRKHFRHERHPVRSAFVIQESQNFVPALHLDPVTWVELPSRTSLPHDKQQNRREAHDIKPTITVDVAQLAAFSGRRSAK